MLKVLSIIVLLFIGNFAVSQNFKGGLIIGLNTSQVSGDELAGFDKPGFVFGGLTTYKFNENFSAQMEIFYNEKGSRSKIADSSSHYLLTLHYLEVPFILGYHYKKFKIEAGPSLGVLISSKEEVNFREVKSRPFNTLEASINIGVNFPIWKHLTMNWRLTNSITAIRQHASKETDGLNRGQANTLLGFTLRYFFEVEKAE